MTGFSLSDLAKIIAERARNGDPQKSHTAKLLSEGVARTAKKFGEEAVEALEGVPEVLEADAVSGPHDIIARVVARDTQHLQEIVNRLVASPAIERSTSHIVLTRQVPPRTAPLVRAAAIS